MRATLAGLLLVLLGATSGIAASDSGGTPKDESLYHQLARAIIRLEDPATGTPQGTAFFANHASDDRFYYLVTARHVVEARRVLRARVSSQRKDTGKTEIIELSIPGETWFFHSTDPRTVAVGDSTETLFPVDVAIAKVPGIKERRLRTIGYCSGECVGETKHQFLDEDPQPPRRILVWGFPVTLGFTLEEQRPMARLGLVALVADQPFIRTEKVLRDDRVLLLDAAIFPGNSGGPIFDYPALGNSIRLAGLVSATNTSLSFAIAEPVSRIAEAMDVAYPQTPQVQASWHLLVSRPAD